MLTKVVTSEELLLTPEMLRTVHVALQIDMTK